MGGFTNDSAIKVKEEDKEEPESIQPSLEITKSSYPFDFSLPELEDLSVSFGDFDFDSLKDWIADDSEPHMAEIKEEPGVLAAEKCEFGVLGRSEEMGKEELCIETKTGDLSGGLGNLDSLIEEELGKVSLEGGVPDCFVDSGVNDSNGIEEAVVGIVGDGVKGGGLLTVKCEVEENSCAIVGLKGNGKINETVQRGEIKTIKCGAGKNIEIVAAEGDGVWGTEVTGVDGNCISSGNAVAVESNGTKTGEKVCNDESDSESESESSSSSSSSSSWSSSSSDEDEDEDEEEEEEEEVKQEEKEEREMEVEEGEIRDSLGEEMVSCSEEDDDGLGSFKADDNDDFDSVKAGPIMSRNELKVLPPVPPVAVTLQPCHQIIPVGFVLSIVGAQVIVEGVEKHNPLNEGSILWITDERTPLGIVDEIFGPVKNPYYIVRYNSDNEVPAGIHEGTSISFVPEFVNHVLNNGNLYKKGYDASGDNDEELSDELEFSDDEKEADYKRMQKMSKRGSKDQTSKNSKKCRNKFKNQDGVWGNDQPSSATQPTDVVGKVPVDKNQHFKPLAVPSSLDQGNRSNSMSSVHGLPIDKNQHFRPPAVSLSLDRGNCSNSMGSVPGFSGAPGSIPANPQLAQLPNFGTPNGIWMNGIPFQQPLNMGFPNGPTPNNMPQMHQNLTQQMSLLNGLSFQQQFNTSQMMPTNFVLPGGLPNFCAGPTFPPWNPMLMSQNNFNQSQAAMVMHGQHAPIFMNNGEELAVSSSGFQIAQNRSFQPDPATQGNNGASQNSRNLMGYGNGMQMGQNQSFQPQSATQGNNGVSQNNNRNGMGYGRGKKSYRRGGGRGRRQPS